MYFPKCSGDIRSKKKYLIKRIKEWNKDFNKYISKVEWKAALISESKDNQKKWELLYSTFVVLPTNYDVENKAEFTWFYPYSADEALYSDFDFATTDVLLVRRLLDFSELIEFLEEVRISVDEKEKQDLQDETSNIKIRDLEFLISSVKNITWRFDSNEYENDWPFFETILQQDSSRRDLPFPLYSEENPYFVDYRFRDFFFKSRTLDIKKDHIHIILPFYVAKFNNIQLSGNKLYYEIENNANEELNLKLLLHSYGDYQYYYENTLSIPKDKKSGEIQLDEEYSYLRVILSEKNSKYYLQEAHAGQTPIQLKDISIPQTIKDLLEYTKRGENQHWEFKETFDKSSILKEMIAFANTNEGIVCIGVKDNGLDYVGIEKSPQKIRDELIDFVSKNCIPSSLPFNVKELKLNDKLYIYLVIIAEGNDKPYFHRITNFVYIRAHGTSRPALRDEIVSLVSE